MIDHESSRRGADPELGLPGNRERLARGPGGGNEHPWSAHGRAETPARMPCAPGRDPRSRAFESFRSARVVNLLSQVTGGAPPAGPDESLGCLATDSS
jgi:hypothetical protein